MKPQFTTPDAQFAIACLSQELSPGKDEIIVPQDLDWDRFLAFLKKNRLAPHFAILAGKQKMLFPEEFRDRLKQERYPILLYGDQCQLQVREVLSAFRNAEIQVIVLKGWALIQWLYGGDFGQRFCEDIDILVPLDAVKKAESVLDSLGFEGLREIDPGFSSRLSNARAYQKRDQSGMIYRPFTIGFHWGLTHFPYYDKDRVNTAELFERSIPLTVAGVDVAELSHEDQVVYTCAHLALHHRIQENLLNYFEIAALIKRAGAVFNWKKAIERAQHWNYFVQLHQVLEEVDSIFSGVIPSAALSEMRQIQVPWREKWIDRMVAGSKGNQFRSALVELIALPGLGNKLRQTWLNLFPPREYMQQRYNTDETNLAKLYWRRVWFALLGFLRSNRRQ